MQISIKPTNLNFTSSTQRQTNQQAVLECRNFVVQQTEQIGNANNSAFAPSADCDTNDAKVKSSLLLSSVVTSEVGFKRDFIFDMFIFEFSFTKRRIK